MIESPASILHDLAGAPALDRAIDLPPGCRCWLCARPTRRGVDRIEWEGAQFQNQNTCREQGSPYVCEPCAWACSWVPPPGFVNAPGAKKGLNLRLFSHFWHAGEYRAFNKASKASMRDWLRAPKTGPWWAAIADSGQKHVIPWTPMNYGPRGEVRFEERDVWLPGADGWRMVDDMTALLSLGVTKDELDRGLVRARLLRGLDVRDAWWSFEERWRSERGGAWWALALWLSQRDEEAYGRRQGPEGRGRAGARDKGNRRAARVGANAGADSGGR